MTPKKHTRQTKNHPGYAISRSLSGKSLYWSTSFWLMDSRVSTLTFWSLPAGNFTNQKRKKSRFFCESPLRQRVLCCAQTNTRGEAFSQNSIPNHTPKNVDMTRPDVEQIDKVKFINLLYKAHICLIEGETYNDLCLTVEGSRHLSPEKKKQILGILSLLQGLYEITKQQDEFSLLEETIASSFTRRGLPFLDLYAFQTLTDYAQETLIFDPNSPFVCTPVSELYNAYLAFFYHNRYKGTLGLEEFQQKVSTLKRDQKQQKETPKESTPKTDEHFHGLTTKYQFARALKYVAKEKFGINIKKVKTRQLLLQGVSLKNPDKRSLQNVNYERWLESEKPQAPETTVAG